MTDVYSDPDIDTISNATAYSALGAALAFGAAAMVVARRLGLPFPVRVIVGVGATFVGGVVGAIGGYKGSRMMVDFSNSLSL